MGRVLNIANPALETEYIALKENSLNGNLCLLVSFILSIHLDLPETGTCSYYFKFNKILIMGEIHILNSNCVSVATKRVYTILFIIVDPFTEKTIFYYHHMIANRFMLHTYLSLWPSSGETWKMVFLSSKYV